MAHPEWTSNMERIWSGEESKIRRCSKCHDACYIPRWLQRGEIRSRIWYEAAKNTHLFRMAQEHQT